MALDTTLRGSSTGNGAEVNASNQLKITAETNAADNPGNVGSFRMFSENDDGTVRPTALLVSPETSDDFRLRVGIDQSLFNLSFEGTNIARDRIQQTDTTATSAQTGGVLTINSGNSTTSGQGSFVRTYRTFPLFGTYPLYAEFWASESNPTATFAFTEFGLGYCTGVTAQLTDGVFLRRLPGGQLRLVQTYASVDISTADITETNIPDRDGTGTYDASQMNHYVIVAHNDVVRCWINDTLVASIDSNSTIPSPTQSSAQPLFARVYNSGTASSARKLNIGFVNVSYGDQATNKMFSHALCGMGGGAYQIQPGTASGPTLTRGAAGTGWPTSATAQTAPTYTATTAPATNSLGGYFITAAVSTLTDNADYPIFSYQNPAGSATVPGKTLYITSVRLSELIAFAAASTNTSLMRFAVGIGSTASATTATEGAAIVAARLVPIGSVFWTAAQAIGDTKGGWTLDLGNAPLVCYPGHFVQLIMRHTGTVTTNTLQVTGMASFIGYHE
jgi:hypothetical protein